MKEHKLQLWATDFFSHKLILKRSLLVIMGHKASQVGSAFLWGSSGANFFPAGAQFSSSCCRYINVNDRRLCSTISSQNSFLLFWRAEKQKVRCRITSKGKGRNETPDSVIEIANQSSFYLLPPFNFCPLPLTALCPVRVVPRTQFQRLRIEEHRVRGVALVVEQSSIQTRRFCSIEGGKWVECRAKEIA